MSITPHNGLLAVVVGVWGVFLFFGGAFGRRGATVTGASVLALTGTQLALAELLPTALDVVTVVLYLGALGVLLRRQRGTTGVPGHRIDSAHDVDTSNREMKDPKRRD